jgi:hypothetical protein
MAIHRSEITRALARGYCAEHNANKPIDIDLMEAMTDEIMGVISTEIQRDNFYRNVRISDDEKGSA